MRDPDCLDPSLKSESEICALALEGEPVLKPHYLCVLDDLLLISAPVKMAPADP